MCCATSASKRHVRGTWSRWRAPWSFCGDWRSWAWRGRATSARPYPQLVESLGLDLTHALARDAELAGELLESRDVGSVEAVTPFDHPPLPIRQLCQPLPDPALDFAVVKHQLRARRVIVGEVVAARGSLMDVLPSTERGEVFRVTQDWAHLLERLARQT